MSFDENEFNEFNDEFDDDDDDFNDDDDDNLDRILHSTVPAEMISKWKETELNLKMNEVNHEILKTAVNVVSNTWFWRFRTTNSKIKSIIHCYYTLNNLIDNNSIYSE